MSQFTTYDGSLQQAVWDAQNPFEEVLFFRNSVQCCIKHISGKKLEHTGLVFPVSDRLWRVDRDGSSGPLYDLIHEKNINKGSFRLPDLSGRLGREADAADEGHSAGGGIHCAA